MGSFFQKPYIRAAPTPKMSAPYREMPALVDPEDVEPVVGEHVPVLGDEEGAGADDAGRYADRGPPYRRRPR